ncbi:MAG: tripartite tricarboxylate transporter substrate binding protein [Alphaproteobacteria bacterium]|nr:tripartite tricarboxylate transporter substrate binding protein [Alphaproteobacteria bacterium]
MRGAVRMLSAMVVCVVAAALWPADAAAQAQAWPQRNVRFIVTLGPGSGADIGARLLADRLAKRWNQAVVVENRPGGDGIVAINAFVNARDDHILLFAPSSSFTAHQFLHDNLPYKPEDLATIARVSNTVIALSVPADMPVKSLKELLDQARAQPGKLNWAGITGALDFLFESFLKSNGIQMTKVPYRNPVEAVNDLAQGRVQVYRSALAIAQSQLRAGKIKALAITNSMRAPAAPDLPTVTELGYPGLAVDGLVGLFGPPTMPLPLRERIAADVKAVMDGDKTLTERLTLTGQIVNPGGPVEFAKAIDEQRATIAGAARILGVQRKQ